MDKGRIRTVVTFVLPLALVATGSVFGVNRVVSAWPEPPPVQSFAATTGERGEGPTDDVIILGDSITEAASQAIRDKLAAGFNVRVRGRGGYRVEEMEPYAIALASNRPEQVIINLGTNDVLQNWQIDASVAGLERIVEEFRDVQCLHLVTVNEKMTGRGAEDTVATRAVIFNLALHRIAQRHGARVIDWAKEINDDVASGSRRGGLVSDGLHPNGQGRHKLATMYKDALDGC